jgi:hypothetical protein
VTGKFVDFYRALVIMGIFHPQIFSVGAWDGGSYLVLKTNEMRCFLVGRETYLRRGF